MASRLRCVNTGRQICNESISQDAENYSGCMLWLNFMGEMTVRVPSQWVDEYTIPAPFHHDRLTISDTGNTVKWFVMRPSFITGEMQDPEWTTHPDYIALLGQDDDAAWDGYIVRISDKEFFKFSEDGLNGTSTPHLWLPTGYTGAAAPESLEYDANGLVTKASIAAYFGTDTVKVAFSYKVGGWLTLRYIDYSAADPQVVELSRPEGKDDWHCESGLISPDGNWIVFNCYTGTSTYSAYVQELTPGSRPVLIAEPGADPHWWRDPADGSLFVVYSTTGGVISEGLEGFIGDDGSIDASLGSTLIRRADLTSGGGGGGPGSWYYFKDPPVNLVDLPFKGGLSPDGRFLCTGYNYAYLFVLP
jgi:hypothetical protein